MASLQDQIDDLRDRMVAIQGSLSSRALNHDMYSMNTTLSSDIDTLTTKYEDLLGCVRDLQDALLAAKQELIDLQ